MYSGDHTNITPWLMLYLWEQSTYQISASYLAMKWPKHIFWHRKRTHKATYWCCFAAQKWRWSQRCAWHEKQRQSQSWGWPIKWRLPKEWRSAANDANEEKEEQENDGETVMLNTMRQYFHILVFHGSFSIFQDQLIITKFVGSHAEKQSEKLLPKNALIQLLLTHVTWTRKHEPKHYNMNVVHTQAPH